MKMSIKAFSSCFERKLSMNVKNDGAAFGYLNVSGHVKDAMPVSVRSQLFTSYILTIIYI